MKDHCVIGLKCNSSIGRTWVENEAAGVEHARTLLARYGKTNSHGKQPLQRLAVVKVIRIIELAEPQPPIVVREMVEDDAS